MSIIYLDKIRIINKYLMIFDFHLLYNSSVVYDFGKEYKQEIR